MAVLFLNDEHVRLKSYSASTKGAVSTIRIDVEVTDPMRLGFLLQELKEIQAELKAATAARKKESQRKPIAAQLALPAPLLRIAHSQEDE